MQGYEVLSSDAGTFGRLERVPVYLTASESEVLEDGTVEGQGGGGDLRHTRSTVR